MHEINNVDLQPHKSFKSNKCFAKPSEIRPILRSLCEPRNNSMPHSKYGAPAAAHSDEQMDDLPAPFCLPPILGPTAPSPRLETSESKMCRTQEATCEKSYDSHQPAIFIVDRKTRTTLNTLTIPAIINSQEPSEALNHIVSPEAIQEALKEEKEEAMGRSETLPFSQYRSFHALKERRHSYEFHYATSLNDNSNNLPNINNLIPKEFMSISAPIIDSGARTQSENPYIHTNASITSSSSRTNVQKPNASPLLPDMEQFPSPLVATRPDKLKRPPNAFLLFNRDMRRKLLDSSPQLTVAEISREVGEAWRALSQTERQFYVNEASSLKQEHRAKYPNLTYSRRTKAELAEAKNIAKISRKIKARSYCLCDKKHIIQTTNTDNAQSVHQKTSSPIPSTPSQSYQSNCITCHGSLNSATVGKVPRNHPRDPRGRKKKKAKHPFAPKHPMSAYLFYLASVYAEESVKFPGATVGPISKSISRTWHAMTPEERSPWKRKAELDKARYAREMQNYMAGVSSYDTS